MARCTTACETPNSGPTCVPHRQVLREMQTCIHRLSDSQVRARHCCRASPGGTCTRRRCLQTDRRHILKLKRTQYHGAVCKGDLKRTLTDSLDQGALYGRTPVPPLAGSEAEYSMVRCTGRVRPPGRRPMISIRPGSGACVGASSLRLGGLPKQPRRRSHRWPSTLAGWGRRLPGRRVARLLQIVLGNLAEPYRAASGRSR